MNRLLQIGIGLILTVPFAASSNFAWAEDSFYVIVAGKRAKKTILVSPQSTQTASGTALLNAVNGITDASETNPYLIVIEPGVYDIGTNSLQMKQYVDMQGSGENVTTIQGNVNWEYLGVVTGASHAELRNLTVKHYGEGSWGFANAIYNASSSMTMTHVTAIASGASFICGVRNDQSTTTMIHVTAEASGGTSSHGVCNFGGSPTMIGVVATATEATNDNNGFFNSSGSPTLSQVTATATGGYFSYGVYNSSCNATMSNVTATASSADIYDYGVYNANGASTRIDHSVISGGDSSVRTDGGTTTCLMGNTRLEGGNVSGTDGGTNTCAGVYDENYVFYPSTCP